MSILIEDGDIVLIGTNIEPEEAVVIDGRGLTALPGLVDAHVHLWDEAELGAYLSYGVTTVRNMSGMPFHLALKARIDAGEIEGPDLLTTGPILNSPGPNAQINHQMVTTAKDGQDAVRVQKTLGYDRVKVYSNLTRPAYEAIRDEAAAAGMRLTGHSPEGVRAPGIPHERPFSIPFGHILDDGFETIEHVESIVWHAFRGRHDEAAARHWARALAKADVAVTPTLLAHRNLLRVAETKGGIADRAEAALLNPVVREAEAAGIAEWAKRPVDHLRREAAFYARVTRIFAEEGVHLVAGSDAGIFVNPPGLSLIEELELLEAAGLSREDVLRAATSGAAEALGRSGRHGRIKEGKSADLVLYACDPLEAIACLNRPEGLVRRGSWFSKEDLQEMRAAAARHDTARTMANLAEGFAAQGGPYRPE